MLASNVTLRLNGQRKKRSSECMPFFFWEQMLTKPSGEKLEVSTDVLPWYAGKVEISQYLQELNGEKKVRFSR